MKASFLIALSLFLACAPRAEAKKCNKAPIRIAILDTGFGFKDQGHEANLCRYGHKDFTKDRQFTHAFDTHDLVPLDVHGHGTNIAGIIDGYLKEAHTNYCFVIVKYYSEQQRGSENLLATIRGINYAANIHADYINYSGGGPETNQFERAAIKRFLNHGGKLISAAGNENQDIDKPENAYYPAQYDKRIIVVGNLCKDGVEYIQSDGTKIKRCASSNYGEAVTRWEVGEDVTAFGITMTGTSQATATATGKIVAESSNKCDIGF
jgi:subtilisin family serine protease